jgi:hypothetical protein
MTMLPEVPISPSGLARATVILLWTVVAVLPLLLLNGQFFTNSLISLLLFSIPIGICTSYAVGKRTPPDQRRTWGLVTILLVIPAITIVANLRSSYRYQKSLKEAVKRLHQLNERQRSAAR